MENILLQTLKKQPKCSKNFGKFIGKHLCQGLFFKLPQTYDFIKKEVLTEVFSCEFSPISKNTFLTEHHWTTASDISYFCIANAAISCPLEVSVMWVCVCVGHNTSFIALHFLWFPFHFIYSFSFILHSTRKKKLTKDSEKIQNHTSVSDYSYVEFRKNKIRMIYNTFLSPS